MTHQRAYVGSRSSEKESLSSFFRQLCFLLFPLCFQCVSTLFQLCFNFLTLCSKIFHFVFNVFRFVFPTCFRQLCQPDCLSALFLHTSTDCPLSCQCCHTGNRVIHGVESQPSFDVVAEQRLTLSKPRRSWPSYESLKRSKIS